MAMKIEYPVNQDVMQVTITGMEMLGADPMKVEKLSDMIIVLLGLYEKHGDVPVYDSHRDEVTGVWFRGEADNLPDCVQVG